MKRGPAWAGKPEIRTRRSPEGSIPAWAGKPRRWHRRLEAGVVGSIPAWAGKPRLGRAGMMHPIKVHPRVGGETGIIGALGRILIGEWVHPRVGGETRSVSMATTIPR